jgi:hypothetical protein
MKSIVKYNLMVLLSLFSLNYGISFSDVVRIVTNPIGSCAKLIDPADKSGFQKEFNKFHGEALKIGAAYADAQQGSKPGEGIASKFANIYNKAEESGGEHSVDEYLGGAAELGTDYLSEHGTDYLSEHGTDYLSEQMGSE